MLSIGTLSSSSPPNFCSVQTAFSIAVLPASASTFASTVEAVAAIASAISSRLSGHFVQVSLAFTSFSIVVKFALVRHDGEATRVIRPDATIVVVSCCYWQMSGGWPLGGRICWIVVGRWPLELPVFQLQVSYPSTSSCQFTLGQSSAIHSPSAFLLLFARSPDRSIRSVAYSFTHFVDTRIWLPFPSVPLCISAVFIVSSTRYLPFMTGRTFTFRWPCMRMFARYCCCCCRWRC